MSLRLDRLLAGALVATSLAAGALAWHGAGAQASRHGGQASSTALAAALGQDHAPIARIEFQGMIVDSGEVGGFGGSGTTTAKEVLAALKQAKADGCKAILLYLNSPGGTASASQAIHAELLRMKAEDHIVVVAYMGDLAASGAYYIACAADAIVANPATLTGSIGVIMHTSQYGALMAKLGVQSGSIKSGKHKDIGAPYRPMTPEERGLLQGIVDDTYAQFLDAVAAGRRLPMDKLRGLADGRIFTGRQAQRVGLVDRLGHYPIAEAEARRLAKLPDAAEVKPYEGGSWKDQIFGMVSRVSQGPAQATAGALLGTKRSLLASGMLDKVPLVLMD